MSDISLHDYYAKLDTLLKSSAYDEVIHHCRHILQYFPKNITAYRYLGAALIGVRRWDEASAVLRRVLSVCPDDQQAHSGLSEVYEHKGQPQDAIWHMERAFEQAPNNREAIERLRALYKHYQQVDQPKVQLTSAAVARQYLRNQNYEQSIETLRGALQRMPDRVDMRLLLAQALWASGEQIEAGEAALDVLQVLPDSLEANRIMAELWLREERPSDAQRYLNSVEAIDPYLALEIAQGEAAPGDAFHLDELDYRVYAQHEMTTSRPDWLKEISPDEAAQDAEPSDQSSAPAWKSAILTSFSEQEEEAALEEHGEVFEDWMAAVSVDTGTSGQTAQDDYEIPEEFATLEQTLDARTDNAFFEALRADAAGSDELPDWFTQSESPASTPANDEVDDPLAWLRDSGVEIDDTEVNVDADPFQADDEMVYQDPTANPHQWAEKYEMDALFHTDALKQDGQAEDTPHDFPADLDFDLPDVDTLTGPTASEAQLPAEALDDDDEDDDYDWLQDDSILDEVLGIEQLTQSGEAAADAAAVPAEEQEFMAGAFSPTQQDEQDSDIFEQPGAAEAQIESTFEDTADMNLFSWELDDQQEAVTPDVTAESELEVAMPPDDKYATLPVWLQATPSDEDTEPERPEWMTVVEAQGDSAPEVPAENAEADQPTSEPNSQSGEHAPLRGLTGLLNDDRFAWPAQDEPAEPEPEVADEPWMRQFDAPQTTSLGSADDIPEWLSELSDEEAKQPEADDGSDSDAQPPDDEPEFEWLSDDDDLEAFEAEINADTGIDLNSPTAAAVEDQIFSADQPDENQLTESSLDSYTFSDVELASPPPAAGDFGGLDDDALIESGDLPDWLSEIDRQDDAGYTPLPPQAETSQSLEAATEHEAEDDAAPVTEGDAVSEFVMALNAPPEEDFEWPEAAAEYEEPEETRAQPAEGDWLTSIMPTSEAAEPTTEDADNWPSAIGSPELAEPEFEPASSDDLAWLDAIQTADADRPVSATDEAEPEPAPSDAEDALPLAAAAALAAAAVSQPDQDETLPQSDSDWPETEANAEPGASDAANEISADEEMPDWMGTLVNNEEMEPVTSFEPEHKPEDDEQPLESEIPDWLNELQPKEEDENTPSPDEDDEAAAPGEIPDWLSELQPIEEDAETPPALEPEDDDEFAWATDDLDAEEFALSVPAPANLDEIEGEDWLAEPGSEEPAEIAWEAIEDEDDDEAFMTGAGAGAAAAVFAMLEDEEDQPDAEPIEPFEVEESADLIEPMESDSLADEIEFAAEEVENEMMPLADESAFQEQWEDAAAFEEAAEEFLMQTPAENAPDWLNAMVPGIDVDYQAEADEPIEEELVLGEEIIDETNEPEPASSGFNWLTNLVEEETSEVEIITDEPFAPIERHQPRFVFTRPPAWLAESGNGDLEPEADSEFPDWVSDDSGDAPSLGR